MEYTEQRIAQHLEGASASLEMVLQELENMWHPYYEKMARELAIAQQQIDRYLTDMRPLAETEV
jgi:exonuclease VII small subunit